MADFVTKDGIMVTESMAEYRKTRWHRWVFYLFFFLIILFGLALYAICKYWDRFFNKEIDNSEDDRYFKIDSF